MTPETLAVKIHEIGSKAMEKQIKKLNRESKYEKISYERKPYGYLASYSQAGLLAVAKWILNGMK